MSDCAQPTSAHTARTATETLQFQKIFEGRALYSRGGKIQSLAKMLLTKKSAKHCTVRTSRSAGLLAKHPRGRLAIVNQPRLMAARVWPLRTTERPTNHGEPVAISRQLQLRRFARRAWQSPCRQGRVWRMTTRLRSSRGMSYVRTHAPCSLSKLVKRLRVPLCVTPFMNAISCSVAIFASMIFLFLLTILEKFPLSFPSIEELSVDSPFKTMFKSSPVLLQL